ncbi:MAG: hypothetical protein ABII09_06520 [Planctomycetota bacterium]
MIIQFSHHPLSKAYRGKQDTRLRFQLRRAGKDLITDFTDDTDYNYGMKVITKKIIGVILIIVGLLALFTPFTPGSWLALIGLELVGIRKFIFRKLLNDRQRAAAEKFMQKLKFKSKQRHKNKPDEKQSQ